MHTWNTGNKMKTIGTMLIGALLLALSVIIIWAFSNSDVLVKAYRYPDAIRAMDISVMVINPVVKK